jgi:hypothetical protein
MFLVICLCHQIEFKAFIAFLVWLIHCFRIHSSKMSWSSSQSWGSATRIRSDRWGHIGGSAALVPRPRNHHKRTTGVLLEDSWSLRVTHSDARATVTHIHMLDRRTVGTTHLLHSADCFCNWGVVTWLIQLDLVTNSVSGFVGTFFECRNMEPQTKMPVIRVCPPFDLDRCLGPEREQHVGSKVTRCALLPSCGLALATDEVAWRIPSR